MVSLRIAAEKVERREQASYRLEGAALARECWTAARAECKARRVGSDHEVDALAAMLAERVARRRERGAARDVLAWIGRAERMPVTAEREQTARVLRGVGRNYLREIAAHLLRDSREWRDLAATYQTRARHQRESSGPMIENVPEPVGYLSAALARTEPEPEPLAEDLRELCDLLAAEETDATPAEQRRMAAALAVNLAGVALDVLARETGRTVKAVKNDSQRGGDLLRERYPDGRDLAARVRELAESHGFTRREAGSLPRPQLDAAALAVARLLEQLAPTDTERPAAALEREPRLDGTDPYPVPEGPAHVPAEQHGGTLTAPGARARRVPATRSLYGPMPRVTRATIGPRMAATTYSGRRFSVPEQASASMDPCRGYPEGLHPTGCPHRKVQPRVSPS